MGAENWWQWRCCFKRRRVRAWATYSEERVLENRKYKTVTSVQNKCTWYFSYQANVLDISHIKTFPDPSLKSDNCDRRFPFCFEVSTNQLPFRNTQIVFSRRHFFQTLSIVIAVSTIHAGRHTSLLDRVSSTRRKKKTVLFCKIN